MFKMLKLPRVLMVLGLVAVLGWFLAASAQGPGAAAWTSTVQQPVPPPKFVPMQMVPVQQQPVAADEMAILKSIKVSADVERLGFFKRRKLGITFRNVARILIEKQKAGRLEGKDVSVLAVEVADQLVDENPAAFRAEVSQRDWASFFEALIAFLEKIIPLILKLIALF